MDNEDIVKCLGSSSLILFLVPLLFLVGKTCVLVVGDFVRLAREHHLITNFIFYIAKSLTNLTNVKQLTMKKTGG